MEAKDEITLSWCKKHKNWWVTNCPNCMIDANEESIKREGRREVVEWVNENVTFFVEDEKIAFNNFLRREDYD